MKPTAEFVRNWSYRGKSVADRFFPRVNKNGPGGCWLWTGSIDTGGYGTIQIRQRICLTHRLSWLLHKGDVPEGLYVLHRCDVRNCVNPEHLWLGTYADNNRDAREKGRWKPEFGESIGTSKLTTSNVRKIKSEFAAGGVSKAALGRRFGVTDVMIGNIVRGKWWKHV